MARIHCKVQLIGRKTLHLTGARHDSLPTAIMSAILTLAGVHERIWATSSQNSENRAGKNIFQSKCATCHDQDGSGTTLGRRINVPDLRSPDVQKQPTEELGRAVMDGRKNMPSFKNSFSKSEVDALIVYVRGLASIK